MNTLDAARRLGLAASLATLAAGSAGAAPAKPVPAIDLRTARIVDLTHPFDERTLYWPTAPSGFKLERLHYGPTAAAAADPDHRLTLDEVKAWEAAHGRVPDGAIVLLRTGWSARWPDKKRYLGDDTPGDASALHFPSYGREAVRWLVDERKVAAIGVDTASIDHGPSKDFPVHQVVAAANVPGLENLASLEALPARGAWVIALPMKIGGGSGGPLRAIALVP